MALLGRWPHERLASLVNAGVRETRTQYTSGHLSTIHIKLKLALKSSPDRNQLAPRANFMRIDVSPSLSPTETEGSTECQLA